MSTDTDPLVGAPAPRPDERSVSEVIASLVAGSQALVKKEAELAKLELKQAIVDKAIALGLLLFGSILGVFILAFVGVTAAVALQQVVAGWIAWAIVTAVYLLVAAVLVAVALRFARRSVTPERTKASVRDTIEWAKRQVR